MFSSWYKKLRDTMHDTTELGLSSHSPTVAQANAFLKVYPLAQLLPYESYDEDSGIYHNRHSMGFVLEASPLLGASEETVTLLNSIIADNLPTGAILQVNLWASPNITNPLSKWHAPRAGQDETIETLSKWRSDYLSNGVLKPLITTGHDVMRDFRLIISVVLP